MQSNQKSKDVSDLYHNFSYFDTRMMLGIVLRILVVIYFPNLRQILWARVEVSTPISSYKRLLEGIYLFQNGISPYEGDLSPILVAFFASIKQNAAPFVFIGLDYAIACLLIFVADYKNSQFKKEKWANPVLLSEEEEEEEEDRDALEVGEISEENERILSNATEKHKSIHACDITKPVDYLPNPIDVGIFYLFNPYAIIVCISQSTQLFETFFVIAALYFAIRRKALGSAFCIAVATYLGLYHIVGIVPCVLLYSQSSGKSVKFSILQFLPAIFLFVASLVYVSFLLLHDWTFLQATYGIIIWVHDLAPNVGLHWYFYMEVFDQFRTFFTSILHLNTFIFAVPIGIYFRNHPTIVAACVFGLVGIFKSYPSIADASLYFPLLFMHPEVCKYANNFYFSIVSILYASVLGPLFFNLWVFYGSGNSNFFYAITLTYSLAQVILVADFMYAHIQREWERQYPGWRRMRVELINK